MTRFIFRHKNTDGQLMLRGLPEGSTLNRRYSVLAVPPQQRNGGEARRRGRARVPDPPR
jgi:hypothetical protein